MSTKDEQNSVKWLPADVKVIERLMARNYENHIIG
jgi:hypothetical protein